MKKTLLWIALAATSAAWAQAPAPKTEEKKEPAVQQPKPQAAKPGAKKKPGAKLAAKKQRRWHEDARHCLDRASNTDVIKCAEEYL